MKIETQLELMLDQLGSSRLVVLLAPLNPKMRGWTEGGCKRVVADRNPKWYRSYCARHPSSRGIRRGKFDTKIKRRDTLVALRRLITGEYRGKYADDFLFFARRQVA